MTQFRKSTAAALAGLGALALLAAPSLANSEHHGPPDVAPVQGAAARVQLAHMGGGGGAPGQMGPGMMGSGQGYGPGPGYRMGPGMTGPGQGCGPGPGYGMGPGMMGPGMMGSGMMGPGMMGQGMMGPGMMGPGMMGPGMKGPGMGGPGGIGADFGGVVTPSKDLSTDDVRHFFDHRLELHGNKRLKVGEVKDADDDTIVAEIVTQDGSLVQRLKVDRHTGQMQQVE